MKKIKIKNKQTKKPFRVSHNLKDKDQNPRSSREIRVSPGTR